LARCCRRAFLFSHSQIGLDFVVFLWFYYHKMSEPKGPRAARLRQRKYALIRKFNIPPDLLPGSLSLTRSRCGKPTCHCAKGEGHPGWMLTFMVDGKKRVERIPADWAEEVRRRVEAGREFKQAISEVMAANAQLLALRRHERK
jgi:hypothetical protein